MLTLRNHAFEQRQIPIQMAYCLGPPLGSERRHARRYLIYKGIILQQHANELKARWAGDIAQHEEPVNISINHHRERNVRCL